MGHLRLGLNGRQPFKSSAIGIHCKFILPVLKFTLVSLIPSHELTWELTQPLLWVIPQVIGPSPLTNEIKCYISHRTAQFRPPTLHLGFFYLSAGRGIQTYLTCTAAVHTGIWREGDPLVTRPWSYRCENFTVIRPWSNFLECQFNHGIYV